MSISVSASSDNHMIVYFVFLLLLLSCVVFQFIVQPAVYCFFPQHFLKIVVEVKASGPPNVFKLSLGVSAPCEIFLLQQILFFVSVKIHGDQKAFIGMRLIWPPSLLGMLPNLEQWCLSPCLRLVSVVMREL